MYLLQPFTLPAACLLAALCSLACLPPQVCSALKIPLYEADFVSQYWNSVFAAFLEGLEQGLTPNPDLACNSHIKFGALLQFAQQKGADVLATGHYARLGWLNIKAAPPAAAADSMLQQQQQQAAQISGAGLPTKQQQQRQQQQAVLLAGADLLKDQTYFLAGLSQQQLASAMFPVGEAPETCN
jgi:tRNA-specific 2-thiouridylase